MPASVAPASLRPGCRALMVCPQFRPSIGGYERAAERLSRELVREGAAVTVITDRRDPQWPAQENLDGVQVVRLWCWFRPRLHLATSLFSHTLWLLTHGRQFDVWHVHQYGTHGTLAVLMGKLLRRPVVMKLTSSGEQSIDAALASTPFARFQKWAHRQVSACIAVSAETAEEALAFGIPTTRVERIPNGIDTTGFQPDAKATKPVLRQTAGLGIEPFVVFVGRLSAEKNALALIDSWSLIVRRAPTHWRLYLIGDGPQRGAIEREIAARNLQDSVTLVGASPQVADWMRMADIYALSSNREGLSNTTIEAMASGLPSVVTAVSGMRDLVESNDAGIVVPRADPPALAQALTCLMDDAALRERLGANARRAVLRDFSIEVVAHAHLAVYKQVRMKGKR